MKTPITGFACTLFVGFFKSIKCQQLHVGFIGTCKRRFLPPTGTNMVGETTARMKKFVKKVSKMKCFFIFS